MKKEAKEKQKLKAKTASYKGRRRLLASERKKRICVGFTPDVYVRLCIRAKKDGRSIGSLCAYVAELGLNALTAMELELLKNNPAK